MRLSALLPQNSVAEVFGQVWKSGGMSAADRECLMSAFLEESLSEEDYATIDRMIHAVRRGWLQIWD
ncbi:MAG: hypothetical protein F6J93_28300 [Oscillatoria sp. SIO1A7]|nr:hypothetical protein [Oscillatoria sp. SIO1A7]